MLGVAVAGCSRTEIDYTEVSYTTSDAVLQVARGLRSITLQLIFWGKTDPLQVARGLRSITLDPTVYMFVYELQVARGLRSITLENAP